MADDPSFDDLMARLRGGDDEAPARVFHRFVPRLVALARGHLGGRLRPKVDPEDVAQSVFRSFFARQADGQWVLEDWDGLWGLLAVITLRKCHRQGERFTAGRREIAASPAEGSGTAWEAIDREPTPADAVALTELVDALMRLLDERERRILELRLQGCAVPEIAAAVGRTEASGAAASGGGARMSVLDRPESAPGVGDGKWLERIVGSFEDRAAEANCRAAANLPLGEFTQYRLLVSRALPRGRESPARRVHPIPPARQSRRRAAGPGRLHRRGRRPRGRHQAST